MWADEQIVISQVKPEALDLINVDELGRFSAEAAGIPKQIVNSAEAVAQIRQTRAQDEAEREEAEAIQQLSELVKTGSDAGEKLTRNEQEVA